MRIAGVVISFVCALLVITGCGTNAIHQGYSGKPLNESEVAIILSLSEVNNIVFPNFDRRIYFTKLNGESLKDGIGFRYYAGYPMKLALKPGKHDISVKYSYASTYYENDLWLEVEAGEKYIVRPKNNDGTGLLVVQNIRTGELTGGIRDFNNED